MVFHFPRHGPFNVYIIQVLRATSEKPTTVGRVSGVDGLYFLYCVYFIRSPKRNDQQTPKVGSQEAQLRSRIVDGLCGLARKRECRVSSSSVLCVFFDVYFVVATRLLMSESEVRRVLCAFFVI